MLGLLARATLALAAAGMVDGGGMNATDGDKGASEAAETGTKRKGAELPQPAAKRRHVCAYPRCTWAFTRASHLAQHQRTVHGTAERSHKCDHPGCTAAFHRASELARHERTHTGERPYVCLVCEKAFAYSSNLNEHLRTHTGERPYACLVCEKSFAYSSHLNDHLRIHTGERPFACLLCEKAFAQSSDLIKHQRTHTGERPFVCPQGCPDAAFKQSAHLTYHMKSYHDPATIMTRKKKEQRVAELLTREGIEFVREHRVSFDCFDAGASCARIDFVIVLHGKAILLEVDEEQHAWYDKKCEVVRMISVGAAFIFDGNNLPVTWIRYNPDPFTVDGRTRRTTLKQRGAVLLRTIRDTIAGPAPAVLAIKYLFYDSEHGVPDVCKDASHALRDVCVLIQ